jgi:MoxR-like ATPase
VGIAVPRVSSRPIVGRDGPLRDLDDALAAPPRLVLVGGEAGVGKTRLVQELGPVLVLDGTRATSSPSWPGASSTG